MLQCETEGRGTAGRFDDLVKASVIGKGGQSPCAQPGRNIPSGFRAVDDGDIVDPADLPDQGCGEETDGTGQIPDGAPVVQGDAALDPGAVVRVVFSDCYPVIH